jgi:hypothetical protein
MAGVADADGAMMVAAACSLCGRLHPAAAPPRHGLRCRALRVTTPITSKRWHHQHHHPHHRAPRRCRPGCRTALLLAGFSRRGERRGSRHRRHHLPRPSGYHRRLLAGSRQQCRRQHDWRQRRLRRLPTLLRSPAMTMLGRAFSELPLLLLPRRCLALRPPALARSVAAAAATFSQPLTPRRLR